MVGHLEENESILIHSGAGATGLASIKIALSMKCEVYTTVSTTKKRELLIEQFPQLKKENIGKFFHWTANIFM